MSECLLCFSRDVSTCQTVRDRPDCHLYSCPACGLKFISPQPSDDFLRKLYSKEYYDQWGTEEHYEIIRKMKISTFNMRLKLIEKFKSGGNILDVGCATGFFLEAARSAGYTPYGVELSEYSAGIAQKRFGADFVFNGILEQCPFREESFDVIVMSDLLEHVKNPEDVMSRVRRLLKADGIVVIVTPDTDSYTHRIMKNRWVHYKLEHLFYFNITSLRKLAERQGFRIIHREPAKKTLNLLYAFHHFQVYRHWLFCPVLTLLNLILPRVIMETHLNVTIGELVAVMDKIEAS